MHQSISVHSFQQLLLASQAFALNQFSGTVFLPDTSVIPAGTSDNSGYRSKRTLKNCSLSCAFSQGQHLIISIFDIIFFSFLRNLQTFNATVVANVPLLEIEAVLSVPGIILQPTASEMEKMTVQSIQDCVEVTKVIFDKYFFVCLQSLLVIIVSPEMNKFSLSVLFCCAPLLHSDCLSQYIFLSVMLYCCSAEILEAE